MDTARPLGIRVIRVQGAWDPQDRGCQAGAVARPLPLTAPTPPLRPALQASHLCLPTAEPAEDPAGGGVRVKVGGRGEGLEGELEAA